MKLDATGKTRVEFAAEIKDVFDAGIKEVFESERWKKWLAFNASFHAYSFRNRFLIYMQNPDAQRVASMSKWNELGRNVIKGQGAQGLKVWAPTEFTKKIQEEKKGDDGKPIFDGNGNPVIEEKKVKEPGFIPVSVYDESQTEGEPLPTLIDELTGKNKNLNTIINACEKVSGVPIMFEKIDNGAKGYFQQSQTGMDKKIVINTGMSDEQSIKTAIHETAHAILHARDRGDDWKKDSHLKEVEAESVAFVVCSRFGIDTSDYSFSYLASWSSGKDLPELQKSLDIIVDTSDNICKEMSLYIKGLNLNKCKDADAVKAYIEHSTYLPGLNEQKLLSEYGDKLLQADKLSTQNGGVFVEIYKSEAPEIPAGSLYSLSDIDTRLSALDGLYAAKNTDKGVPKAYSKIYCTLYYPQTLADGSRKFKTVTQKYNAGIARGNTFSQTLAAYSKSAEQLKGIINAEVKAKEISKSKYRKR